MTLGRQLEALRQKLADTAQIVVDEWDPDEEGFDEVYGGGGPCDAIANAMADVIAGSVDDVEIEDGGWEGDEHAWLLVSRGGETYAVDIPPGVYETGGGYSWYKIEDVVITAADVVIEPVEPV